MRPYLTRSWRALAPATLLTIIAAAPVGRSATPGIVARMIFSLVTVTPPPVDTLADKPNINAGDPSDPVNGPPAGGGGGAGGAAGAPGAPGGRGGRGGGGAGGRGAAGGAGAAATLANSGLANRGVMSLEAIPGHAYVIPVGIGQNVTGVDLHDSYILGDSGVLIVNSATNTYTATPPHVGSIEDLINAMDSKKLVAHMNVAFDTLADTAIAGVTAHHVQLRLQFTIYSGTETPTPATTMMTSDYWIIDSPIHFRNLWLGFAWPKEGYSPGNRVWVKKLTDAEASMEASGLIVMNVAKGVVGTEIPRPLTFTRTMEITGIAPKDIDESIFQIPAGVARARGGPGGGGAH